MDSRFGSNGVKGRPSGIRPPTNYKPLSHPRNSMRPSDSMSVSSIPCMPSSTSSRKYGLKPRNMNAPGSGSSVIMGRNNNNNNNHRMSGFSSIKGRVSTVFGGIRSMSTARKSNVSTKLHFGFTPQQKRLSYSANSCSSQRSARRSSVIGTRHITENRPLTEKTYHIHCVEKVISFLTQNNYPHQISKRLASHPTNSDVTRIFEFLFSFIDPRGKVVPIEIEVPKMLQLLEYPFAIKKSDFQSFTNGRSLGSLLGTMEWLVDSLNYLKDMNVERTFYAKFDGEIDIKQELVKLAISEDFAESDFNDAHDPKTNQLRQALQKLADNKFGTDEEYAAMCNEEDKLKQEIDRLDNELSSISDLPNSIQTYRKEIENYEKYNKEMEEYCAKKDSELQLLEKENEEKVATLKRLEEQKRSLISQVEAQEFGVIRAEQLRQEKELWEEELRKESYFVEEQKKNICLAKLECSKYEDILKKMFSDSESFIHAMTELVNSPLINNYAHNLKKFVLNDDWLKISKWLQNRLVSDSNDYDLNEFEKLYSEKVSELKMAIVEHLSSLQGTVSLNEQQRINELDLLIEEEDKKVKKSEQQVKCLMAELENKRKVQMAEISAIQSEIDVNRQYISELDNNRKQSNDKIKENLLELQQKVTEREQFYQKEKEEILNKWKERIATCKTGIKSVESNLDKFVKQEEATNIQLKKILAKTISTEKSNRNSKK